MPGCNLTLAVYGRTWFVNLVYRRWEEYVRQLAEIFTFLGVR